MAGSILCIAPNSRSTTEASHEAVPASQLRLLGFQSVFAGNRLFAVSFASQVNARSQPAASLCFAGLLLTVLLCSLQVGTHIRAKRKREELSNVLAAMRKAAAKKD